MDGFRTFCHSPVQALNVCPLIEEGSDLLPVPGPILLDQLGELVVFLRIPISFRVVRVLGVLKLILLSVWLTLKLRKIS